MNSRKKSKEQLGRIIPIPGMDLGLIVQNAQHTPLLPRRNL